MGNFYCVVVLKFYLRGLTMMVVDPFMTFPNPDKDEKGLVKCVERADFLRKCYESKETDQRAFIMALKEKCGIPRDSAVTFLPMMLKDVIIRRTPTSYRLRELAERLSLLGHKAAALEVDLSVGKVEKVDALITAFHTLLG